MSPATPGLTVLLVPPTGDTALLADEAGGVVPQRRRHRFADQPDRWGPWVTFYVGHASSVTERALVLMNQGAPVAMGWDRVRSLLALKLGLDPSGGVVIEPIRLGLRVRWILRTWDDESRTVTDDVDSLDLRDLAPAVAAILGARVVLLRDGQEVAE